MGVGVAVDSLSKNGLTVNLLQLLQYVGVGFFLGNAGEHFAAAVKKRGATSTVDTSAIEAELSEIKTSVATNQQALGAILTIAQGGQQGTNEGPN